MSLTHKEDLAESWTVDGHMREGACETIRYKEKSEGSRIKRLDGAKPRGPRDAILRGKEFQGSGVFEKKLY